MVRVLTAAEKNVEPPSRIEPGDDSRVSGAVLAGWAVLLAAMPVYVFESGLPQPADIGLVLFLGAAVLTGLGAIRGELQTSATRLSQYVGWIILVNMVWNQIEGYDRSFVFATAFAVFNAVVFVGFISFARRDPVRVLRLTGTVVALCLVALAFLAVLRPDLSNGSRLTLLFNNPNQLAYYCLGALTLVLLIRGSVPGMRRALVWAAMLAAGFVIYRSYSRSALAGYALLCIVPFIRRPEIVIAAAVPLAILGASLDSLLTEDPLWQQRIDQVSDRSMGDYLEDRGVDRIVENPHYLAFGSGEGMHERFHPFGLEMHSSFAGVLFYYGLPGLALLLAFLWSIVDRVSMSTRAFLAPALVYSFFHNGMRFRVFWLLLAVVAVINAEQSRLRALTKEDGD